MPLPPTLGTLIDQRAASHGPAMAYGLVDETGDVRDPLSYARLCADARRLAECVARRFAPRDRLLVAYPSGSPFVVAFAACAFADIIAVPVAPPRRSRDNERFRAIVRDARPAAVLTTAAWRAVIRDELQAAGETAIEVYATDGEEPDEIAPRHRRAPSRRARPEDVLYLQYTSGSIAQPKGVLVTHRNLLSNAAVAQYVEETDETSVSLTWLPNFHDMGLVEGLIQPLFSGVPGLIMSPASFLQRPRLWLEAITRHRVTTSGAPNFAYQLCVDKAGVTDGAPLDLGSWHVAYNGAEPVRHETLRRFLDTFGPCGFRETAFYPVYGLAEATLVVTSDGRHDRPVRLTVDRARLEQGEAVPVLDESRAACTLVASGAVLSGRFELATDVVIADPATAGPLADGRVGEVLLAGPSIAGGYWNHPEDTAAAFGATVPGRQGTTFLRTGDLGFLRDGRLFLTGRRKDLIITRGRNLYPHDIEWLAAAVDASVRPWQCAAFTLGADTDERIVVVSESPRHAGEEALHAMASAMRDRVADELDVELHDVLLIPLGTLPKTSSGKTRRLACRDMLARGELSVRFSLRAHSGAAPVDADAAPLADAAPESAADRAAYAQRCDELRELIAAGRAGRVPDEGVLCDYVGDSVRTVRLCHALERRYGVVVPVSRLFGGATLASLAAWLPSAPKTRTDDAIPDPAAAVDAADGALLPLSHEQGALWFLAALSPHSVAYHIVRALEIRGALDADVLRRALDLLVARHDALRTRLTVVDGVPFQAFDSAATVAFTVETAAPEDEDEALRRIEAAAWEPFVLEGGPLWRMRLLRLRDRGVLLLSVHHVIADLWSIAQLLDELLVQYEALEAGRWLAPPAPGATYADVVRLRRQWLASDAGRRQQDYWRTQVAGLPAETAVPTDRPRPPAQTFTGAEIAHDLPADLAADVDACARRLGTTAFCVMLATYLAFLARASGQPTVTAGVPVSGRARASTADTVGLLAQVHVIRGDLTGQTTLQELVRQTHAQLLAMLEASDYPLAAIVDDAGVPRDPRMSPLFQHMFSLETPPRWETLAPFVAGRRGGRMTRAGLTLTSLPLPAAGAQFDLHARFVRQADGVLGTWTYNVDLFDAPTIARWAIAYANLLRAACRAPEWRVETLPIERPDDLPAATGVTGEQLALAPAETTLQELMARQACETPDRIAITYGGACVTYRTMRRQARRIARALLRRGVKPDERVAVRLERSLDLPLVLMGILEARAAYVPIATDWPPRRVAQVLAEATPALLIVDGESEAVPSGSVRLATLMQEAADETMRGALAPGRGEDAASVLFTSGSTGPPKGAINTQRGLVNRLCWMQRAYALTAADRVLQKTPYTFDVSAWELFWPLLSGTPLVMAPPDAHRDPLALARTIVEQDVTVLHFVPSMLDLFLQEAPPDALAAVRLLVASGEVLSKALEAAVRRHCRAELHNLYGPTEAAIDVTAWPCPPDDEGGTVPIGRPIANITIRLLHEARRPVLPGAAGELCIAGVGLARGYIGRPDLTALAFRPDPYDAAGGGRLYRTGDRARLRSDLACEFLGRLDHQIKVRGVRIELTEIEAVLRTHPTVAAAAVAAPDTPARGRALVACCVPRPAAAIDTRAIRHWLAERLPEAMVPASFAVLDALPLLESGKVDRAAVERLALDRTASAPDVPVTTPPRTASERALAAVWEEVLGLVSVGVTDTFFDLGGDSLLILRAAARARARGLPVTAERIYHRQTIARICADLESRDPWTPAPDDAPYEPFGLVHPDERGRLPADLVDAMPLTRLQEAMVYHIESSENYIAYVASAHLRALFRQELWERAVEDALARHPYLRVSFASTGFREPLQFVHRRVPSPLYVEDLRHLSTAEQERHLAHWIAMEKKRRFAWDVPPLFRLTLHRRTEETCQITLTEVTLDGWSIAILLSELCRTYASLLRDQPPASSDTVSGDVASRDAASGDAASGEPSYGRFVRAERDARADAAHRALWRRPDGLARVAPLPRWPAAWRLTDRSLHARQTLHIREDVDGLRATASRAGAAVKHVFLAAHLAVLRTLTGQDEVLTSLITHGRPELIGGDAAVGLYTNTLPLQARLHGRRWIDLVCDLHRTELAMFPYRRYPFADIATSWEHPLLMESAFNFTHFHAYEDLLREGRPVQALSVLSFDQTYFALTAYFNLLPGQRDLTVDLDYNPTALAPQQVALIAGYYERALHALAAAPAAAIADTELLSPGEIAREIVEWNPPAPAAAETPLDLVAAIAARCRQTPDRIALVQAGAAVTYGTLWRRASALRARLRALGVGPDIGVGVQTDREPDTIVALLAVLDSGGFFVPLDPCAPPDRRAWIIEDAHVQALIVDAAAAAAAAAPAALPRLTCADDAPASGSRRTRRRPRTAGRVTHPPQALAYCMYTSGATGTPKGVEISRAALASFVPAAIAAYGFEPGDRLLQFASLSFDAALEEIFCALSIGATLVLRTPEDLDSFDTFLDSCAREALTVLDLPTAFWHRLTTALSEQARRSLPSSVRLVILGGEEASAARLTEWRAAVGDRAVVINSYGPTEGTIVSLRHVLDDPGLDEEVPIGTPLDGVSAYVLTGGGRVGPVALLGDLCLGGRGLARGYRGRGDLTAERFRPHPHGASPGERLYWTGDLARRRPDGALVFGGRRDEQVKVRGYRIELAEIERALQADARVSQAAVIAWRPDGARDAALVAFIVASAGWTNRRAWTTSARDFVAAVSGDLARRLPAYMLPARIEVVSSLPSTRAGKIDKARLRPSVDAVVYPDARPEPPRDAVEWTLAAIIEACLDVESLPRTARFSDVGGDSLSAMKIVGRVQERLGVRLTVRQLFDAPSLAALAAGIAGARRSAALAALPDVPAPAVVPGGRQEMSDAQERLWFLYQFDRDSTSYNVPALFQLRGDLNLDALHQAFQAICGRHEVLRTRFLDRGASAEPIVTDPFVLPLPCVDLRSLDPAAARREAAAIAAHEAGRPFDLTRDTLIRVTLVHVAADEAWLVIVMHHIVTDEWCTGIFVRELRTLYDAISRGEPPALPALPLQYADYARWRKAAISGPRLDALRAFWRRELAGAPPVLPLPFDGPRTRTAEARGARHPFQIPSTVTRGLRAIGRTHDASLFMVLLSAYHIWLHGLTGLDDIVVGSPITGRTRPETEPLIGFFANLLALRGRIHPEQSFTTHLAATRETALSCYDHQELSFAQLVSALNPDRAAAYAPIVQVIFGLWPQAAEALDMGGLQVRQERLFAQRAKYDLEMQIAEAGDQLRGFLEYDTASFRADTIAAQVDAYQRLCGAIVERPAATVATLRALVWPREAVKTS